MRWLLSITVFLGFAMNLRAATFVYVSMAAEQKIQIFRLDTDTGKLTAVDALVVEGAPGSLAVDPHKKFLFASLRSTSTLASFQIDAATGKLKHMNTAALPKNENAAFVSTDPTGRWLLSASYMAGKVVVHKLNDGTIESPPILTVETAKTAHCIAIAVAMDNHWLFVPHVAPNAVFQFRLDAATGKLTEAGKAAGGAPEAGPRHLALHPTHPFALTSDEVGNSITIYRYDPKSGLTPLQTAPTLTGYTGKNTTAEVKVHPNGKFAWVSNRGHDSLAGFAIDLPSGKLKTLGQTPTEKTPRSFDLSPDGRFLFAAGEGSGKLAVYRIGAGSGALERIATQDVGKSLTWVMAVELGK